MFQLAERVVLKMRIFLNFVELFSKDFRFKIVWGGAIVWGGHLDDESPKF
jgi:hypothetical protein